MNPFKSDSFVISSSKSNQLIKDLRKYENLHIAFWLVKDTCWCMSFKPLGMFMIIPTLYVALDLTWRSRRSRTDLFHNIAVTLWICANAIWMTSEFYYNDKLRPYSMVFFTLGLLVIGYYYLFLSRRKSDNTMPITD